ncbi:universal stress protein [Saliphagus infecundisoli]|uniref:Universal stress protein n=1 Tax=Saliphagus infecundisoli TaxID=1849069 RepID=A0ABD5QJB0_9EURY|nr:universal stress protein [Saliphagus infecundisoli]
MDRGLVVVESADHARTLIREAGELAAGVGAGLVLLTLMDRDEYEHDLETMETIADIEGVSYTSEDIKESGRRFGRDIAREEIGDLALEYESICAVVEGGGEADRILEAAQREGCDHVFIAGRKRSPTGKALFGDTTQKVILNFDGVVSVVTA